MAENVEHKALVYLIGDLDHTPSGDEFLVEQDHDYVLVCKTLSRYWELKECQQVWVRTKNHYAWLRDFTEQIGCLSKFSEMTARMVLAEQWNVTLPQWLTDEDVLKHKLLKISIDATRNVPFETRFLAHFFGDIFEKEDLHGPDIVPVISALAGSDAKALFEKYPLLQTCLDSRCNQWKEHSEEQWIKELCAHLQLDSFEVWQWLSLWSGLHNYPGKLLEYVLPPEQASLVRNVPPDAITDLPLEPNARDQILTQIEFLFNEIREQVTSSEEFQKVTAWCTGKFSQEYRIISSILKAKQFPPKEEDIKVMQEKFKSCPGVSESQLNSLIFSVQPKRPTLINDEETWGSSDWVRWAAEEYTPYRTWQTHTGQHDQELEQTVARFSDWYVEEYVAIHKDPDLSLAHCLRNIPSKEQSNTLTVILLVDCLPIAFAGLLDQALRNVGLSRHDLHYRFAGLPSITKNNKMAILSGQWQREAGGYEAVLKKRSVSEWNGVNVVYLSNLKALSDMEAPQETTVAVLNLLDGDETLHSDTESKNTTHEDELHRIFSRLAEAVNNLSQEWTGPKDNFNVYVLTDHGACRVLEEEMKSFESETVNKLFANERHRFSEVKEDQAGDIPENLWDLGYRFKPPFSDEDLIFFLPRGHNTVRRIGADKGYMHGGVTPEEVIVPIASYKMVKVAWVTPSVRFLKLDLDGETRAAKFYIQRVVALEMEIQNLNSTEIHVLRATVISPDTDLKSCEPVAVPAGGVNVLKMNCYFKKAALDTKGLEIEIIYEIAGEQRTLPVRLEAEFSSAMSAGLDLRDL